MHQTTIATIYLIMKRIKLKAEQILFSASTPADWVPPVPDDAQEALDQLAQRVTAGGGGVTGSPNAMVYLNPIGAGVSTSPDFLGGVLDGYQRPCVRDFRFNGGLVNRGAVHKLGAWGVDGDPQNVTSEGFISYGPSARNIGPDSSEGGFGWCGPGYFGVLQIIPGVNGGGAFYSCGFEQGPQVIPDAWPPSPFNLDGFIVNDDTAAPIAHIRRSDAVSWFRIASMDAGRASEAPNKMAGIAATGPGGTIAVLNASVKPTSRIMLTIQPPAGGPIPTAGVYVSAIVPGVGFTIQSFAPADVGILVYYQIWEP